MSQYIDGNYIEATSTSSPIETSEVPIPTVSLFQKMVQTLRRYKIFRLIFPDKLGMISGVIGLGILNILGAILFLRYGVIIGNVGWLWTLSLLFVIYYMNITTILSLSAIATNGKMGGGGAYFIISRTLGPEFGSAVAVMVFIANAFACVLDIIGLVEFLKLTFPAIRFTYDSYAYGSALLCLITLTALLGSRIYTRITLLMLLVVISALILILVSLSFQTPGIVSGYTGWSFDTFKGNMGPNSSHWIDINNLRLMYGLLVPGTSGFLAGFSISGDLKNPNRDLPKGTLITSLSTLAIYLLLLPFMVFTVSKQTLMSKNNILGQLSFFYPLHFTGVVMSTFCASFVALVKGSRIACVSGRDALLPLTSWLGIVVGRTKEPVFAVIFTWFVCQLFIFLGNVDVIAPYVSLSFMLMYFLANVACFLLSASLVPNFRPSFRYFSWWTAATGALVSLFSMFFIDALIATIAFLVLACLMLTVYFFAPAKTWGNISKSIIYYQTRKYILKMEDRYEHVKYWRFKPLVLCSNPRSSFDMLSFFTEVSRHRGGLAICGHIDTSDFRMNIKRHEKETEDYFKLFKAAKWSMYPCRIHSSSIREGVRSLLSSGVSLLQSNTLVMGFYDDNTPIQRIINTKSKKGRKIQKALASFPSLRTSNSKRVHLDEYMEIMKDAMLLKKNIIIARNFQMFSEMDLQPPGFWARHFHKKFKYIDLWMLCVNENNEEVEANISLMLQIAYLMRRSGVWKKYHRLRVQVIIDQNADIKKEKQRILNLLSLARVKAKPRIIQLSEKEFDVWIKSETPTPHRRVNSIDSFDGYDASQSSKSTFSERDNETIVSKRSKKTTISEKNSERSHPIIRRSRTMNQLSSIKKVESLTSFKSKKKKNTGAGITKSKTVEFVTKAFSIGDIHMQFPATVSFQRSDGTYLSEPEKYLVLNNVIKSHSDNTTVILISMPPPPPIFNQSVHKEYQTSMSKLTEGLPATLLIYGAEQTISTKL